MKTLDLKNLQCPMPILKTKQALQSMALDEMIEIVTTDPHSEIDFKSFLSKTSHELVSFSIKNDEFYFVIQKK